MSLARASIPASIPRAVFAAAAERGIAEDTLAKAAGFDPTLLDDPDDRVPALVMLRIWDEVERLTGDPTFGLFVGKTATTSAMPLAGRLVAASATLGEGLARVMNHYRLFNDAHPSAMIVEGDEVRFRVDSNALPVRPPRLAIEFAFAWAIDIASIAVGERLRFRSVSFEHDAPPNVTAYEETFGCPASFSTNEASFSLERALLDRPTVAPDVHLIEILERYASMLATRLPARENLGERVREVLRALLVRGDVAVELAAETLGMSPRTLQRKLREEGLSFSALVDEERCELAKEALKGSASLAEIALRLGFSDQSAFHRAFVRWTGRTPGDFRRPRG